MVKSTVDDTVATKLTKVLLISLQRPSDVNIHHDNYTINEMIQNSDRSQCIVMAMKE